MGLFSRKPEDGVSGVAHVVAATAHSGRSTHQTCRLNLVVTVTGWSPYSVEHSQICPAAKWPNPGEQLAVIVSRSDPTRLKIDFDAMPDAATVARQQAEQMAAQMRHGGAGAFAAPGATVQIVGGSASDIPPDLRAGLEQMLGVDLDGDGRVGGPGAPTFAPPGFTAPGSTAPGPSAPSGGSDDRLAQLERLAALHRAGALTDAEFAAEKRRLLG